MHLSSPYVLLLSGIGLETSLLFASEGCSSILADINLEAAQKTAQRIHERYPDVKAIAIKCDVSKEAEVEACVNKAVEEFGRLDIVVSGFRERYKAWNVAEILHDSSTTPVSCTLQMMMLSTLMRRSGILLKRSMSKEVNYLFSRRAMSIWNLLLSWPLTDPLAIQHSLVRVQACHQGYASRKLQICLFQLVPVSRALLQLTEPN